MPSDSYQFATNGHQVNAFRQLSIWHQRTSPSPLYLQRSTLPQPAVPSTWTWCFMLHIIIQWSMVILWCLSRSALSYGLIVILVGMIVYFIYGVVLRCPPSRTNMRGPCCRVLQYVHCSLRVGGESDRNLNPSRWGMMYGSKEDLILNAMVGFYLNEPLVFADAC